MFIKYNEGNGKYMGYQIYIMLNFDLTLANRVNGVEIVKVTIFIVAIYYSISSILTECNNDSLLV